MDLIGSINYIENRLGGRKPNQGREKPAQKNARSEAAGEKDASTESAGTANNHDSRLGRKIDTTA